MGFDIDSLSQAVAEHGRVARVVVAAVSGSAPREVGAAMMVWSGGQSGTIGGGALEYAAAENAFVRPGLSRHPLGPSLGQCCGGSVTLLTEVFAPGDLMGLTDEKVFARGPGPAPLAVRHVLEQARGQGFAPPPQLIGDWFVEPVSRPEKPLWIWGAGHVGRALVGVLDPVGEFGITWVDTAPDRFPKTVPDSITVLPATDPTRLVRHAPHDAAHLILTYSHTLDLGLCDALLRHGFGWTGLIGSDTKWARFRSRLRNLGHSDAKIDSICCPIGQKSLGKHPQAIAVGVAAQILSIQINGGASVWGTPFYSSTG